MIRDLCSSDNRLIMPQIAQMFTNARPPIGAGKSPHFLPQIAHLFLLLRANVSAKLKFHDLWRRCDKYDASRQNASTDVGSDGSPL